MKKLNENKFGDEVLLMSGEGLGNYEDVVYLDFFLFGLVFEFLEMGYGYWKVSGEMELSFFFR